MVTVSVARVDVVDADVINLVITSDLAVGSTAIQFQVTITRADATYWLADNPGKTIDDYILMRIQTQYNLILKIAAKANSLVNKTYTW